MSRQRLADLSENINTGIYKDPGNDRVPLWSDGKNIVFDPEGPRPVHGFSRMTFSQPTNNPIRGMLQAWVDGNKYVFFGDKDNLFKYDDDLETASEVSKTSDVYTGEWWSFAPWGAWVLATNGSDVVQVYKETNGAFADLASDISITAPIVRTTKAHAIFFGTDDEGRQIRWSDEDDVTVYTSQIDNAAGSIYVRDAASPIRAAIHHPDGIVFYGDSTIHLLRYVGPPYYYGQHRLSTNAGALGKNAVVGVGNTHFGIGLTGIWAVVPGQEPEYIARPQLHNYVFNDLDFDNADKCVAWYDEQQDLIVFSYPSLEDGLGEPTRSVALTIKSGGWSPMDFAASAAAQSPVFQYTSAADFRGGIFWHGVPRAGGGLPFDTQAFISMSDDLTIFNYYGLGPYGKFDYGGP